jgi:hypothetical protein
VPAAESYPNSGENVLASARRARAVTCSDTVEFPDGAAIGLLVKTAGDYTILLADDTTAIAMNLAAGVIHPIRAKRVNSTSAASTSGVVAFYSNT